MTEEEIEAAIRTAYDVFREELPLCVQQWERTALRGSATWAVDHGLDPGWLVADARSGWRPAHDALCDAADALTAADRPLPLWLQRYVVDAARMGGESPKRGRHARANLMRNAAIAAAVYCVAKRFSLPPTRNAVTGDECASSVVATALREYDAEIEGIFGKREGVDQFAVSEASVAAIWRKHREDVLGWRVDHLTANEG